MNSYDVRRLALVLAIQAEIEGMKVANSQVEHLDHRDPIYTMDNFCTKVEELRGLAFSHDEQL